MDDISVVIATCKKRPGWIDMFPAYRSFHLPSCDKV